MAHNYIRENAPHLPTAKTLPVIVGRHKTE